jgi:hypothetical protein
MKEISYVECSLLLGLRRIYRVFVVGRMNLFRPPMSETSFAVWLDIASH